MATGMGGVQPGTQGAGPSQLLPQAVTAARRLRVWDLIIGPEASNWSSLLVRDHLDPWSRWALSRTCTAARDMVLVTAEQATLTLLGGEGTTGRWLRRTRAWLQLRGRLSTKLHLCANSCMVAYALGVLEEGTTWVDRIEVSGEALATGLPTTTLATMGRCCPNTRTLTIRTPLPKLPSPDLFPKVQELHATIVPKTTVHAFCTLAPYLGQLTGLTLDPQHRDTWPPEHTLIPTLPLLLFGTGEVARHLRTLHIPAVLDDELLGALLQRAPALDQVMVWTLHLQTYTHTQATARWRVLTTNELHVGSLARLPLAPRLKVVLGTSEDWQWRLQFPAPVLVCDLRTTMEAGAARLRQVQISGAIVHVRPGGHALRRDIVPGEATSGQARLSAQHQPAALRLSLSVLNGWPHTTLECVHLKGWTMTSDLANTFTDLPHAAALHLDDITWLPDPQECSSVLRMLPVHYSTVVFWDREIKEEQVKSLCLGAPAGRTRDTRLDFCFKFCEREVVQRMRDEMLRGNFPYVRLCQQ